MIDRVFDDFGGLTRIRAFAVDYYVVAEGRPVTSTERHLIEAALIDYLLGEEWSIGVARLQATAAVQALQGVARHLPPIARPAAKLVERCLVDLAARLDRREVANVIIYEELTTLSETIRRLRESNPT